MKRIMPLSKIILWTILIALTCLLLGFSILFFDGHQKPLILLFILLIAGLFGLYSRTNKKNAMRIFKDQTFEKVELISSGTKKFFIITASLFLAFSLILIFLDIGSSSFFPLLLSINFFSMASFKTAFIGKDKIVYANKILKLDQISHYEKVTKVFKIGINYQSNDGDFYIAYDDLFIRDKFFQILNKKIRERDAIDPKEIISHPSL
ncbi:MAG: hypothetical protein PWP16_138 [Eubacteriaceae bacterium]|nr:hypothetical protein [Eubacteriaceae bacterium]MDN5306775.1 hypothetical protein [Eubacteriaceae bacterium]